MEEPVRRAVIHQPQFNPYLGVVAKYLLADEIVHLDTVQFVKNEFQNRNRIRVGTGWQWLTVPVLHRHGQPIDEVLIDPRARWQRKHLRTLAQAYSRAPQFECLFPQIEEIYERRPTRLVDWNRSFLEWVFQQLGVSASACSASEMKTEDLEPNARLLSLVREREAGGYIAGEAGPSYMSREAWLASGVEVVFIRYRHPTYPQPGEGFVPFCGVLDLLFNLPPEQARSVALSGVETFGWPTG